MLLIVTVWSIFAWTVLTKVKSIYIKYTFLHNNIGLLLFISELLVNDLVNIKWLENHFYLNCYSSL